MEMMFLAGRVLFGGYFLYSAWNHFIHSGGMAHYAASKGVPAARVMVLMTGLLLLAGGAGVLFGVYIKLALGALVVFLAPVTFWIHAFWMETEAQARMGEQVNFYKNLALLGAALMMFTIAEPWPQALF